MNIIYHLAYSTLHHAIQFKIGINDTIQWIEGKIERIFYNSSISHKSIETIKRETSNLKKPKHIAFLFKDDDLKGQKINEILKLIIYSIAANIEYITLFTPNELNENILSDIKQQINLLKEQFLAKETKIQYQNGPFHNLNSMYELDEENLFVEIGKLDERKTLWKKEKMKIAETENVTNSWGLSKEQLETLTKFEESCDIKSDDTTTKIMFISQKDGKETIALATRVLSKAVKNQVIESSTIDQALIHSILSGGIKNNWPSPDFIVNFNYVSIFNGFLPWHIRYSEILPYKNFNFLTTSAFYNILKSFGNRSQRFGK